MARRGRRHSGQRGITAVVSLFAAMALLTLILGGVIIGLVAMRKLERQAQADALATTAARIAFEEGLEDMCDSPALAAVIEGNSRTAAITPCPFSQLVVQDDGTTVRRFVSDVNSQFESPFRLLPIGTNVVASAQADIPETVTDELELSYPKLVLILDYSGSMINPYPICRDDNDCRFGQCIQGRCVPDCQVDDDCAGGQCINGECRPEVTRIAVLREAVRQLIDRRYRIHYGLVIFDDGIMNVVNIEQRLRVADELLPQEQEILGAVNQNLGGRTNYIPPLRQASGLLQSREPTGYYILFITDGEHNEGGNPISVAADVREGDTPDSEDDVEIFTLFIGDNPGVEQDLQAMAGTAANPGNPDYSFSAANPDELLSVFDEIIGSIVCRYGPLGLDPGATSNDVKVWLRAGDGTEEKLEAIAFDDNRPNNFATTPYFEYLPEEDKIRMNQIACDRVLEGEDELVLRSGRVSLVQ